MALFAVDFVRNGITVAVARTIHETEGRYRLLGHWDPQGMAEPFQGYLTLSANDPPRRSPGRPKGSKDTLRAIAASLCKDYCRFRGLPYAKHAHKLMSYSDLRSVNRAARKAPPFGNGATFFMPEGDGYPDGYVIHCPKGNLYAVSPSEIEGDGFLWAPYQRQATATGFRFSGGTISQEWAAAFATLQPGDQ